MKPISTRIEWIPFESMCPICAVMRPQHGFDRNSLLRLLSSGYAVEAYCAVCDKAWSIGAAERAALFAATRADGAAVLADRIASESRIDLASKQTLLEILDPLERLQKLLAYLNPGAEAEQEILTLSAKSRAAALKARSHQGERRR